MQNGSREYISGSPSPSEEIPKEEKEVSMSPGLQMSPLPKLTPYATTKIPKVIDFYAALKEVEKGKKITKAEWGTESIYGYLKGEILTLHKSDGQDFHWIIRDADMLGDDWKVIDN